MTQTWNKRNMNNTDNDLITAMIEAGRERAHFAPSGIIWAVVLAALFWGLLGAALSQLL